MRDLIDDETLHNDDERLALLESCLEFRSSCKRIRAATTILILNGCATFDVEGDLNETDVCRRLSSNEEDDIDTENASSKTIRNGKKKKRR